MLFTVADAAVTVVATTVKVGATVVGTTVDVAAAGVKAVVNQRAKLTIQSGETALKFDHPGWKIRSFLAEVTGSDQYGKFCEATSATFGAWGDNQFDCAGPECVAQYGEEVPEVRRGTGIPA